MNEQERLEQLDDALEGIGDHLMSGDSYVKLYYDTRMGSFSIELYNMSNPGHMRDNELNRVINVEVGLLYLQDAIMALSNVIKSQTVVGIQPV